MIDVASSRARQTETMRRLKAQIARGAIRHSYLLVTPDKALGEDVFWSFAAALQCESNGCFNCPACRRVLSGNHTEIFVYQKLSTAEAEELVNGLYVRPIDGQYKLYFIQNIENVLPSVQNKLLKSLEEPPEYAVFFLTAANEEGVLRTVTSRCERFYETSFDLKEAEEILSVEFLGDDFVYKAVLCSNGFLDEARARITDAGFRKLFQECVDMVNGLKNSGDVCKYIYRPLFEKEYIKTALSILETITGATVRGIESGEKRLIFVCDTGVEVLSRYIYLIDGAIRRITYNTTSAAVGEWLMMGMLEERYKAAAKRRVV